MAKKFVPYRKKGRARPAYRKKGYAKRSYTKKRPYRRKASKKSGGGWGSFAWDMGKRFLAAKALGGLWNAGANFYGNHFAQSPILGDGDYKLRRNSLMSDSYVPVMHSGKNYVRIRHREYLGDVSGSTAWTSSTYSINPGQSATFPWLSQVAACFEEYAFAGLIFEFKSTSADALNSTNTALGTVVMATEYNPYTTWYTTKQDAENAEFTCSTKPSSSAIHGIECDPQQNPQGIMFVRTGGVPSGADKRWYDLGVFGLATVGMQAAAVIGELWASYDVYLYKPQLGQGLDNFSAHFRWTTGASTTNYFGTDTVADPDNSPGITASLGVITMTNWPPGQYLLTWDQLGASTSVTNPTITATTGCALQTFWDNNTITGVLTPAATTTTRLIQIIQFNITSSSSAVLTFTVGTLPTSPTYGDLVITQLNRSL